MNILTWTPSESTLIDKAFVLRPTNVGQGLFPLWAAAIGIISCYASLHLHLSGENNLNRRKTSSNTAPMAPMPSTRSTSAAKSFHSTIYIKLRLVG